MTSLVVPSTSISNSLMATITSVAGSLIIGSFPRYTAAAARNAPNGGNDALRIFKLRNKVNGKKDGKKATQRQRQLSLSFNSSPLIELYRSWFRLPQIFRFFVSGNLGNLGFFYTEKVIYKLLWQLLLLSSTSSSVKPSAAETISSPAGATAFCAMRDYAINGIEKYHGGISFFSAYLIQIVTTHLLYG